ncbi:MAG: hypothetical protein AAGF97_02815 [Planctomycetota bacterium]
MWRSLVLALGLSLCAFGGEFMVVDRLIMADKKPAPQHHNSSYQNYDYLGASDVGSWNAGSTTGKRAFVPPEWAPWGLLSAGVLTVLYGATLPSKSSD